MNVTPSIDIIGAGIGAITRAGPGTYIDSAGALQTAPANVLRMSYDPANLSAAPRPLYEPAATNLLAYSEGNVSTLGPQGGVTNASTSIPGFDASIAFGSGGVIYAYRDMTVPTADVYVFSAFVAMDDGQPPTVGDFSIVIQGFPYPAAHIDVAGNGMYRVSLSAACVTGFSSAGIVKYPEQGTRGFRVAGYQLELGSKASSYIKTTGAPVTRAADNITGTGLIYSSAIETAPAAYASGTTYAQGASVSVAGLLGALDCYTSLQGGNIGHSPASSPLHWAYAGTTYAPYASGTTFTNYQRCIDPAGHLVYESLIDGNTGAALADGTKWKLIGYTNPFAAFDTLRNTRTVGANPLVMIVKPGQRINALALVGLKATSANITLLNGYEVASCVTRNLNTRDASDAYKYCFNPFSNQEAVTLYDLPPYYDGVVVISLVNAFGPPECGGVFMGTYTYIGAIQYEAESDALNFSTVERDSEGNAEMKAERNVPKLISQIFLDKRLVKAAYDLRDQLNGTTAVWDGLADDTDGYAAPLLIQGFYRRFTINVKYPQEAIISLELEEV